MSIAADDLLFFQKSATGPNTLLPLTPVDSTVVALDASGALVLKPWSDFQGADADLAAIAALTTTSFGRGLLTLADAAALRTLIGQRAMTSARLTTDFTTTLATLQATSLSFAIGANECWQVTINATAQCSGTGGLRYGLAMPTGTAITGVAAGINDVFTKTAHGLQTGQRVIPTFASGFTGLTTGAPYWVRRLDADTFLLCTTLKAAQTASGVAITGVSAATTGIFTKTAHGLITGDRVTLTFSSGFGGAVSGTTYWVTSATTDTFKLASSLANAQVGTAITISSSGTGGTVLPTTPAVDITAAGTGATLTPIPIVEGWVNSSLGAITTLSYQRLTGPASLLAGGFNTTALHTVATTPGGDTLTFSIESPYAGDVTLSVASATAGQTSTLFTGAALTAIRTA